MPAKGEGKSKFIVTPANINLIEKMAEEGYSAKQIAKHLGISRSTLYEWRKKFPDISDALKRGLTVSAELAESALYAVINGYTFDEITEEGIFDPETGKPVLDGFGQQIFAVTKRVTKIKHPDTTAIIFALKNLMPAKYGDHKDKCIDMEDKQDGDSDLI